jgi:signal transduction histidine kinase
MIGRLVRQVEDFDYQVRLTQNIMAAAMVMNEKPLQVRQISLTELAQLIKAVADVQREVTAAKSLNLGIHQDIAGEDVTLWIDADRIQQAVTNMIAYATKDMRPHAKVEVRTARASHPDEVIVAVSAPGPERPAEEELRRMSEPYAWIPPPSTAPLGGDEHGHRLGLSIAKTLVEAHGGRLWAEHNDRGGFTVKFALRVRAAAARRVRVHTRPPRAALPILPDVIGAQ